jgi:S-methylmethionine-dependent homocysteine/selenocysteine methylase
MLIVATTPFYELQVAPEINRIYFTAKATLSNPQQVPDFYRDWLSALGHVAEGFTFLADLSKVESISHNLEALTVKLQQAMVKAGIFQAAEVFSKEEVEVRLTQISGLSHYPLNIFDNTQDAERWLDEVVHEHTTKG